MGAPAARVSELARYWAAEGHDVTVLTGFPNHPTGVLQAEYRSRFRHLVCRERMDGIEVVRTWLIPMPNRKPYERMLNNASFSFSACITGAFLGRPDVVIATSPQLLVGICGWWISRVKNIPFVFEIRDLWPESLSAVGIGNNRSLLYRALVRVARFLYRACDHLIVVTPAFKEYICRQYGIVGEKISVVPNGVESDLFSPSTDRDGLRTKLGLDGKLVISYIGTIGMAHDLDTILEAARVCAETMPEVTFLIAGEGAEKERIIDRVRKTGVRNLLLLPQQQRDKIPMLVSASDVCVVTLKRSDIFKTVIPTKMLEFMSCAKPVILAVEGQAAELLTSAGAGICVKPENPGAILDAIKLLGSNREFGRNLGQNGRTYITENLSRAKTAETYIQILRNLNGHRSSPLPSPAHSRAID